MATNGYEELIGRRLGQYELKQLLGVGGMGGVYRARDCALNRIVAVKVLSPTFSRDRELVARFQREAQAAARLNHPNIVQIYTVDVTTDPPYMAMEYVNGQSLDKWLEQNGALTWNQALFICAQVASALDCAHAHGFIHRDIKPANILVEKNGRVRVSDFGIAKALGEQSGLTATGTIVGTPTYMSPEQCGVGELCPASDIFSLGSTLYELISGRVPFKGETAVALLRQITQDQPPRISVVTPGLPKSVEDFVHAMMAKDLGHRYDTAAHVMEDAQRLQNSQPPRWLPVARQSAVGATAPVSLVDELLADDKPRKPAPRAIQPGWEFPWRTVAIAAAVLFLFGMLFLALRGRTPAKPARPQPPALARPVPGPPPQERLTQEPRSRQPRPPRYGRPLGLPPPGARPPTGGPPPPRGLPPPNGRPGFRQPPPRGVPGNSSAPSQ